MTKKDKDDILTHYIKNQQRISQLISEGKIEVEKVNLYLDLKVDIDKLLEELDLIIDKFHEQESELLENELISTGISAVPSYVLSKSKTSYISPGYHLNQYLNTLNEYTLNNFKKVNNTESELKLNVYVQSLFSSIKTLIDRLIPLLTFYYPGLSVSSTFGRIKDSGKATGLMSKVIELEEDPVMLYIRENYEYWIKGVVAPRDMLMHYNDFSTRYHYPLDGRVFPMHLEIKIFDMLEGETAVNEDYQFPHDHTYKTLSSMVYRAYEFYLNVLKEVSKKEIKLSRYHFNDKQIYNSYVESLES